MDRSLAARQSQLHTSTAVDPPEQILEAATGAALTAALRGLADLVDHAGAVFADLQQQSEQVGARCQALQQRCGAIHQRLGPLESTVSAPAWAVDFVSMDPKHTRLLPLRQPRPSILHAFDTNLPSKTPSEAALPAKGQALKQIHKSPASVGNPRSSLVSSGAASPDAFFSPAGSLASAASSTLGYYSANSGRNTGRSSPAVHRLASPLNQQQTKGLVHELKMRLIAANGASQQAAYPHPAKTPLPGTGSILASRGGASGSGRIASAQYDADEYGGGFGAAHPPEHTPQHTQQQQHDSARSSPAGPAFMRAETPYSPAPVYGSSQHEGSPVFLRPSGRQTPPGEMLDFSHLQEPAPLGDGLQHGPQLTDSPRLPSSPQDSHLPHGFSALPFYLQQQQQAGSSGQQTPQASGAFSSPLGQWHEAVAHSAEQRSDRSRPGSLEGSPANSPRLGQARPPREWQDGGSRFLSQFGGLASQRLAAAPQGPSHPSHDLTLTPTQPPPLIPKHLRTPQMLMRQGASDRPAPDSPLMAQPRSQSAHSSPAPPAIPAHLRKGPGPFEFDARTGPPPNANSPVPPPAHLRGIRQAPPMDSDDFQVPPLRNSPAPLPAHLRKGRGRLRYDETAESDEMDGSLPHATPTPAEMGPAPAWGGSATQHAGGIGPGRFEMPPSPEPSHSPATAQPEEFEDAQEEQPSTSLAGAGFAGQLSGQAARLRATAATKENASPAKQPARAAPPAAPAAGGPDAIKASDLLAAAAALRPLGANASGGSQTAAPSVPPAKDLQKAAGRLRPTAAPATTPSTASGKLFGSSPAPTPHLTAGKARAGPALPSVPEASQVQAGDPREGLLDAIRNKQFQLRSVQLPLETPVQQPARSGAPTPRSSGLPPRGPAGMVTPNFTAAEMIMQRAQAIRKSAYPESTVDGSEAEFSDWDD
ncbi:hypothetical protein WJX72_012045 [[Myrmecia] bisecta]|uniref:WH2 domain-containing protein n=1 Tax=[Myrmecia] bisecta TaxID=41462 RepID=A0AAW1PYY0_9CHLO